MFKKIEIWILYLVMLLGVLFTISFGALVRYELLGGQALKSINAQWLPKAALNLAEIPMSVKKILKGIGNDFTIDDRFPGLGGFDGSPNSEESYLLLSRYDGDLKQGVVELVDLTNFDILHTWNPDIDEFNSLVEKDDEFKYLNRDGNDARYLIYHPLLLKDGGLMFGWDAPFRKINACSELIFQQTHNRTHHAIEIDSDGNVWVPSRIFPLSLPSKIIGESLIIEDGGYHDDGILKLSNDGEILFEKSVSQILIENGLEYLLYALGQEHEKYPIHLNDVQPVNSDGEYWKKGDVFLSIRNQSMIILYRPSTNEIIWKGTGPFLHQHDIDILDNHTISVFNNRSINVAPDTNIVDGHNEIVIYDFEIDEYTTYLSDSLIKNDVRTITQGANQILPNGDLFIVESNAARTLYFDSDGSLRWTHLNRSGNGNVYSIGWSRILYTQDDILTVKNFLTNKGACNE